MERDRRGRRPAVAPHRLERTSAHAQEILYEDTRRQWRGSGGSVHTLLARSSIVQAVPGRYSGARVMSLDRGPVWPHMGRGHSLRRLTGNSLAVRGPWRLIGAPQA
jgi:hypothetical protein